MSAGNFDEALPPPPTPPPSPPPRSYRLPAEYYCAPLSEVRPMFPRWIPYGCGVAAALFLVFLFVGGTILSGERFGEVVDFVIGMSLGEMRPMYSKDITAEEKAEFEAAVKTMREGLRSGKVSVAKVQPFLKSMQDVTADKKVTEEEIEKLTRVATETAKSQQPRAKPR